jgi:hypothetical protein
VVVAIVRELHVEITGRVAHETRYPYDGIAATQKRQDFAREMNVYFLTAEPWFPAKEAY